MRSINEIIVHCSATPEGKDFTVADITRWHKARGFRTIGYHYVVYRDGSIHTGRPLEQVGAHCLRHNAHSIGICYIGGCAADGKTPKDTRTEAQTTSLLALLRQLKDQFPNAAIHGHRDFAAKACPSFDATREYKKLAMALFLVFSCFFLSACRTTQRSLEEKVDSTMVQAASTTTTSLATDKFLQSLVLNIDSIVFTSQSVSQVPETVGCAWIAGRTSDISDSYTCSGAARLCRFASRRTLTSPTLTRQGVSLPRNREALPPNSKTKVVVHGLRLKSNTADSSSVKTEVFNSNTQQKATHSSVKAKVKTVPTIRWPLSLIAIAAIIIAALAWFIRKKMK